MRYKKNVFGRAAAWAWTFVLMAPLMALAHHSDIEVPFTAETEYQVPGATLQSRTNYVLKVAKSGSDRHVLQILNENKSRVLATFVGVADRSSTQTEGFSFIPTTAGSTKAVRIWFYPGEGGLQFVYPEQQAQEIARGATEPVLGTKTAMTGNLTNPALVEVRSMQAGTGNPMPMSQVADNLPETASPLPLLALIGSAAVASGIMLRSRQTRPGHKPR